MGEVPIAVIQAAEELGRRKAEFVERARSGTATWGDAFAIADAADALKHAMEDNS